MAGAGRNLSNREDFEAVTRRSNRSDLGSQLLEKWVGVKAKTAAKLTLHKLTAPLSNSKIRSQSGWVRDDSLSIPGM